MNMSFYSAAAGAAAHQSKLDVVANNMANVNTYGYKAKSASFSDLMYNNLVGSEGENSNAKMGSGVKLDKTNISFNKGNMSPSESKLDFYIEGRGFFGVQNPQTKEIVYTTNGNFVMSEKGDEFYLSSKDGNFVLGKDGQPITINDVEEEIQPAVYEFPRNTNLICVGDTNFISFDNGVAPIMVDATVRQGSLESSNVDISQEMTRVIEAQRAYQYSLKMIQTTDEVQNLINNLR